jgi:Ca-activated chloride channel family protein
MSRLSSTSPGLKTSLLLTVCALALTGCLDELRERAEAKNQIKKLEQEQALGKNTYSQPRVLQPQQPAAQDGLGSYAVTGIVPSPEESVYYQQSENTENYLDFDDNPVKLTLEQPVSTFSVDVDTVSYSNTRRILMAGGLPPKDAVRAEEMINYFDYDYAKPGDSEVPFAVTTEVAPTPWNQDSYLVQIGIEGYGITDAERPPANLVFLIDVSGSMDDPAKLPLLINAFKLMVQQLGEQDHVAIVVYAGAAGVVLEPTPGNETSQIVSALTQLSAGGSTAGGEGIELAYALAKQHYQQGGINRVILATDGDFNVGVTDFEMLKDIVERNRESGIELTTLGFGGGNYNEALLEQLADVGNGNAFYIDTLNEARKVLVEELSATLFTIAQDVKIQVEFNPAVVAEYRLIGYENRELAREDFNNDKVDAGDIGAGHTVTAIYEVVLVGSEGALVDPLRYENRKDEAAGDPDAAEFAFVKIRYKLPGEETSKLIEQPLMKAEFEGKTLEAASDDLRFAAAVAAFAQLLRGGEYLRDFDYADVIALAQDAKGEDPFGYRAEFVQLVKLAAATGA